MGTNFYWKLPTERSEIILPTGRELIHEPSIDREDPDVHIGKRSAAGLYCWDCRTTLVEGGERFIHHGGKQLDRCPKCNAEPVAEGLSDGPVAVELGFAKPRDERPIGVRGASSFTWAQNPAEARSACERHMDDIVIEDEYGRSLTGREFLAMLTNNCPIEFMHVIGVWFS